MQFMMLLKSAERHEAGPPPQALMEALGTLMGEMHARGALRFTGGLMPAETGVRIRVGDGAMTVTDGPFAEAKEVIGGFAMVQVDSKAEAVELAEQFMAAHRDHWPGWTGESEVRQVVEATDPTAATDEPTATGQASH